VPYVLNLAGLIVSGLLVNKQLGYTNDIVDKACKQGKNSDCDSVLNSSASKIFGIFPLSEIAFLYFSAMTISMIISSAVGVLSGYFLILSGLGSLFTIFTIYYQWRVIKKWCPLCLVLSLLLWGQFAFYIFQEEYMFSLAGGLVISGCFVLLTAMWINLRDAVINSIEVPVIMRKLNRFRQSTEVFDSVLNKQPLANEMKIDGDLVKGSLESPLSLILVSHPGCKYCANAHKKVDELFRKYGDKLRINYRFNVHPQAENTTSYQVLFKIFKLNMAYENGKASSALADWYKMRELNIADWNNRYDLPEDNNNKIASELIKKHYEWCNSSGVTHTPTVFFNNRKLPEEFELEDLDYHIGKMSSNK